MQNPFVPEEARMLVSLKQFVKKARRSPVQTWTASVVAAFIAGGAASVSASLLAVAQDPEHYNLGVGLGQTLKFGFGVFVLNGIVRVMTFLSNKPLPWDGSAERRNSNGEKGND